MENDLKTHFDNLKKQMDKLREEIYCGKSDESLLRDLLDRDFESDIEPLLKKEILKRLKN